MINQASTRGLKNQTTHTTFPYHITTYQYHSILIKKGVVYRYDTGKCTSLDRMRHGHHHPFGARAVPAIAYVPTITARLARTVPGSTAGLALPLWVL